MSIGSLIIRSCSSLQPANLFASAVCCSQAIGSFQSNSVIRQESGFPIEARIANSQSNYSENSRNSPKGREGLRSFLWISHRLPIVNPTVVSYYETKQIGQRLRTDTLVQSWMLLRMLHRLQVCACTCCVASICQFSWLTSR